MKIFLLLIILVAAAQATKVIVHVTYRCPFWDRFAVQVFLREKDGAFIPDDTLTVISPRLVNITEQLVLEGEDSSDPGGSFESFLTTYNTCTHNGQIIEHEYWFKNPDGQDHICNENDVYCIYTVDIDLLKYW